ncbi:collagen binding domain-containing protein [Levilactobacillus andaensis]|uniref:collagen binding domain-containing protein n=1 Tax=Levilactobacillus andaensis TaxID=2799570 RepID=UPI001F4209F3|nr:collagen binding domain-containing protein [Levilactobacillus andaensis]
MKKNSQVWKLLIGLVSLVMLLVISTVPVKAATNHSGAEFTTSAKVTNGPDFKHADTIDIQYKLDFGSTPIHNGDTITLDLPANLKAKTPGDTFDVLDTDGTVIGKAVVSDGKVVMTMNAALEGKTNDKLTVNLATKYRGEDSGEKDVIFDLKDNQTSTSVINMVTNEANLSKKGVLQDDGTIKWTILVNRQEITMKNLEISDTIGDYQEMIHGVTVSNAHWVDTTNYKREKPAMTEDDYKITYSDQGFTLKFNDTVSNLVTIDYYTKVTDTSLIDSGYKFKNKAIMTWGGGASGGKHSEEANGKVSSSNGNGAVGGGDNNEGNGNENNGGNEGNGGNENNGGNEGNGNENNGGNEGNGNNGNNGGDTDGVETSEEEEDDTTGTIDVDGGTETDAEEAAREDKEGESLTNQAEKKPAKKAKAKKSQVKAAKVSGVTATEHPGKTTTKGKTNTKLPQTGDRVNGVAVLSGSIVLMILGSAAVIRRHF